MNKFNIGNYKLPHMAPFKLKRVAEKKIKPITRSLPNPPIQVPKPLKPMKPNTISNAAMKQVVDSSGGEVTEIDNDSLASDKYYEKIFNQYMNADKDPRFGPATEQDRWREFLMENYSTRFDPEKGKGVIIEASNPEPGQDVFPSEADVQAVDPKFRIPQRFSWEAYNKKFPRK